MSAYNKPSQEQSIFNPTNYSTAISKLADGTFDEIIATTATFTNLLLGSDNVATSFNSLQTRVDSVETNHITLQTQVNTNTTNLAPINLKNTYLPQTFVITKTSNAITNHFLNSQSFSATNTDYEFATFEFTIPDTIDGVQQFLFETNNIARVHSGSNNHLVLMKYAISTDNYATKTIIRYYHYETGSTNLLRGSPYIAIKGEVGDLTGSGNVSFTIKLYVRTTDTNLTLFGSDYETAKLMIFD